MSCLKRNFCSRFLWLLKAPTFPPIWSTHSWVGNMLDARQRATWKRCNEHWCCDSRSPPIASSQAGHSLDKQDWRALTKLTFKTSTFHFIVYLSLLLRLQRSELSRVRLQTNWIQSKVVFLFFQTLTLTPTDSCWTTTTFTWYVLKEDHVSQTYKNNCYTSWLFFHNYIIEMHFTVITDGLSPILTSMGYFYGIRTKICQFCVFAIATV